LGSAPWWVLAACLKAVSDPWETAETLETGRSTDRQMRSMTTLGGAVAWAARPPTSATCQRTSHRADESSILAPTGPASVHIWPAARAYVLLHCHRDSLVPQSRAFTMPNSYRFNMTFEAEVRRVAEAVWGVEPGACQPSHYPNDPVVREIDGIARLRDVTHLIMATTSTRLDKAREDVKKLLAAELIERTRTPAVSKWLITEHQLDAQHIELARKSNVIALTLEQFQRRFFDSGKYLALRERWAFGSARDPQTNSVSIADNAYIALPITVVSDSKNQSALKPGQTVSLHQLVIRIAEGGTVVLKAPFGSGKSLTTREIFKHLSKMHRNDPTAPIPLTLNLRDHWGEDHSDEILERHARSIGYTPREDVVVAWRAGMCCLLLDGFDEVASQTVVKTDNKNFMHFCVRSRPLL
jgi:hypothetical protein